ncbi:hypothetical protein AAC387_Pa07g3330 [Persea americana]
MLLHLYCAEQKQTHLRKIWNVWRLLMKQLDLMVSDSVIKGMVGAISEEAAEKVASKEVELLNLNEKLHFYASNMRAEKEAGLGLAVKSNSKKLGSQLRFHDLGLEQNHTEEHLINLKIAAEEQIQRLKKEVEDVKGCISISTTNLGSSQQGKMLENGIEINKSTDALQSILEAVYKQINNLVIFSKTLLYERQWESEFRDEVDGIVFQSLIGCLKEEFEEKSHEQSRLFGNQHKNLMIKVDELSRLRQELDAISRSLFTPEPGKLSSHGSHEFVEEWSNIERKDRIHRKVLENHPSPLKEENGATASEKYKESKSTMPDATELALQHMSKDKLINYFKDEMTKMKRNHESILQEKTEEYYSLKREYLKEKDSPNWRKEKEFDALRKKIPEVIIKLGDIIVENEKPSVVCDVDEYVNSLKVDNKRLHSMLMDKRKEVKCLSLKVSDAADKMSNLSLAEENFSKQIKKLKCDIEDANVEVCIREEVYKSILRELIDRTKCDMGNVDIETIFTHEICMIVFRESLRDAKAAISDMMMRYNKEKEKRIYLEALLLERDAALVSEIVENEKLKEGKALMSVLMEEKERSSSEVGSTLIKQKEQFELACKELQRLTDETRHLERYKVEKSILEQKLKEALDNVKEMERHKSELYSIIQEKKNMISTAVVKELNQWRQMKSVIVSVQELSRAAFDFESRVMDKILLNNSRFETLNHQCRPLVQQANLLKKKGLAYKRGLERRCSDLQKAELEVDLLGDQVDALQSLLGKIYMGLDHYSPVLQHYPGIMETLELIRRAIEGETVKPV